MTTEPVREEAERLVAAAIWAVTSAARGLGAATRSGDRTGGFATGSLECCLCPVCRVIAAMRDPSSDLAERLATGAGDLAAGVTGLLRAFAGRDSGATHSGATHSGATHDGATHDGATHDGATHDGATHDGGDAWEAMRRRARGGEASSQDPWHAATTGEPPPPVDPVPHKPVAKKAMAKKAVAKKVVKKVAPPSEGE